MPRILLIEDDPAIQRGVGIALRRRGHEVAVAPTGEAGLATLEDFRPDLVLLDLMLPGINGLEVCRRIRERHQLPIIILTARGDDIDIVVGLEAGADDYVVKPAGGEVLGARIKAALRRAVPADTEDGVEDSPASRVDRYGELTIDRAALIVSRNGTELALAPSELKLLLYLSASAGCVYSRDILLERVWECSFAGDARLVDACVLRLRGKVENDPRHPRYVQTVRGFGYRFGPL
ncbi:response regulator transcription factor [Embleya scabrispora]|uniref:response regulator transcription factor n=1 Tax=Embleya scabrispora TaxID=159449 RepID=UPI00047576A2|nr:response regulator transcription factor [Embleya scabrispora]MYS79258.1 response regulator [Streptomyces sp. SID5474]